MEFSISKGTKRFLIDLLYFYKVSNYKTYEEMLKYLSEGDYDDEIIKEWKVFTLFKCEWND